MNHPYTELKFISDKIGYGVVATKFIPKGTIAWGQDRLDHVYSPAQLSRMNDSCKKALDFYSFKNSKGNFVLCWDLAKYVNHNFKSNCLTHHTILKSQYVIFNRVKN